MFHALISLAMRIYILLLLLLSCPGFIHSQEKDKMLSPEEAAFGKTYAARHIPVITGRLLHNAVGKQKERSITYTLVTPFSNMQKRKTAAIQPDGRFRLELDHAFPYQQVWFEVASSFYAALYVNTDLYVELDMKKIKPGGETNFNSAAVRYLGTDGPLNIYMNNYILYRRQEQQQLSGRINQLLFTPGLSADTVLRSYNILIDSVKQLEDAYIAGHPSPYGYILENERLCEYYGQVCGLYRGRIMEDSLWQKIRKHKGCMISNSSCIYYSYMENYIGALPGGDWTANWKDLTPLPDLTVIEKALLDSLKKSEVFAPTTPYSTENMQNWIKQLQPRIRKIARDKHVANAIGRTDSLFAPAKADFLKLRLYAGTDLADQAQVLQLVTASMHSAWCIAVAKKEHEIITAKINAINASLASAATAQPRGYFGKPLLQTSFGASMYKVKGIKATDFLTKLHQWLPGKAIIIDRWATWCQPCISEMPHSKELQQASTDLPVAFVYLCTSSGSSESKWKLKVAELQQPGIHFFIDGPLDDALSGYFSFAGYPGYAFIDKQGNYVPGAFKRISQVENKEALAQLISK